MYSMSCMCEFVSLFVSVSVCLSVLWCVWQYVSVGFFSVLVCLSLFMLFCLCLYVSVCICLWVCVFGVHVSVCIELCVYLTIHIR